MSRSSTLDTVGKWALGYSHPSTLPTRRGFDSAIGFHGQSIDPYQWHAIGYQSERTSRGETIFDLFINETRVTRQHPFITAGIGKMRYNDSWPSAGGRLGMFESGDAHGHLRVQADDELGRFYAQDVFSNELNALLEDHTSRRSEEPFFILMSTPAVHPPLDSRHRHRVRTFAARRAQLSEAAHCPWHDQWANTANPAQCTPSARTVRFEREAMAVGVDEAIGGAVSRLRARGAYNRTLMIFLSDNGGRMQLSAPNTPLRGGKSSYLEGGIHVRASLGGGYVPSELSGRHSRTLVHEADFYPTLSYLAGLAEPYDDPIAIREGVDLPIDGRNAAPSWRRLYETTVEGGFTRATNELISASIADWCTDGPRAARPAARAQTCVPGTRLVEHDRHGIPSSGHAFTFVHRGLRADGAGGGAYKVYSWNALPFLPPLERPPHLTALGATWQVYSWNAQACKVGRFSAQGCPWDPRDRSYLPNTVCPPADGVASCPTGGPCLLGVASGGPRCSLYGPHDTTLGCTRAAPCVFQVADDIAESTYLTVATAGSQIASSARGGLNTSTLESVARYHFGLLYPSPDSTFTPTPPLPAINSSDGRYRLPPESRHYDSTSRQFYREVIYEASCTSTYDRLAVQGTYVLGPVRGELVPPPPPPPPACTADHATAADNVHAARGGLGVRAERAADGHAVLMSVRMGGWL